MIGSLIGAFCGSLPPISQFYLALDDTTITASDLQGNNVTAVFNVYASDGVIFVNCDNSTDVDGTWWINGTPSGTWHMKMAYDSGDTQDYSGETMGSWVALTGDPQYYQFQKTPGGGGEDETNANYTFSLSDDGGSTTYDSISFSLRLLENS